MNNTTDYEPYQNIVPIKPCYGVLDISTGILYTKRDNTKTSYEKLLSIIKDTDDDFANYNIKTSL